MNDATLWLIAAALLLIAEMMSGTLYLIAVSAGLLFGALCAWLGLDTSVQFIAASIASVLTVGLALQWKRNHTPSSNPTNQLDVGQRVDVESWRDESHARVHYRGTLWEGELAAPDTPRTTSYVIVAHRGNTLILDTHYTPSEPTA